MSLIRNNEILSQIEIVHNVRSMIVSSRDDSFIKLVMFGVLWIITSSALFFCYLFE